MEDPVVYLESPIWDFGSRSWPWNWIELKQVGGERGPGGGKKLLSHLTRSFRHLTARRDPQSLERSSPETGCRREPKPGLHVDARQRRRVRDVCIRPRLRVRITILSHCVQIQNSFFRSQNRRYEQATLRQLAKEKWTRPYYLQFKLFFTKYFILLQVFSAYYNKYFWPEWYFIKV